MEALESADPAPAPNAGDFAPGMVLGGSYRLVKRLVSGGMGDVHLASHERLPGSFVVKVLSPVLLGDEDALARFRQEALVLANIRHPNVVHLVDFNATPSGLPYLVMEHLPGQDLADILASGPSLSPVQISGIVRQVACALDAAHKKGIVHRDMKPENIMVVPCEGQGDLIKVIDFGISKARRFNHVTAASMVIGTPEFMSPEQAEGRHDDVDARSDQFALAVTTYLLLTGRTPWGTMAPIEILHRIVHKDPAPLSGDDAWPSIEEVLLRAMAKAPGDRYPSILAFWRALDRAMIKDGLIATATTDLLPHLVTGDPRRRATESAPPPSSSSSSSLLPASLDDGDADSLTTTRLLKGDLIRRSGKGVRAREVLLGVALACGIAFGLRQVPVVRAGARRGWLTVRGGIADAGESVTNEGRQWRSPISKAAVARGPDGSAPLDR